MDKKNLQLKKSLKPVSEEELQTAAGGGRPTMFGCCGDSDNPDAAHSGRLLGGRCTREPCP